MAKNKENNELMEKIVSLCKRRGFVFPSSEIYGGLANAWDFGPMGVELKNNIKQYWWKKVVQERDDIIGLDSAIIMNPKVWEASGHVVNFSDPLIECANCHSRFRADQLIENNNDLLSVKIEIAEKLKAILDKHDSELEKVNDLIKVAKDFGIRSNQSNDERLKIILIELKKEIANRISNLEKESKTIGNLIHEVIVDSEKYFGFVIPVYLNKFVSCKTCGQRKWDMPKPFNLMFKTFIGPAEEDTNVAYLRPETAQGIFVDFKNIIDTSRVKIPFGVAQIGKAFRNEITPGNFIFRTREFEQMEVEYFFNQEKDNWEEKFDGWLEFFKKWMNEIGVDSKKLFFNDIEKNELAHYSKRTIDVEFEFPFGKKELFGLAYRTNFDLERHGLNYRDPETQKEYTPHVIEPSMGVDRMMLALIVSAYTEEEVENENEMRMVLKLDKKLAPIKVAVFPLLKNKPELVKKAREIYDSLKSQYMCEFDDNGNIGKRYRRQDEI